MKILLTGGAGYIGSITATALEEAGHQPILIDSFLSGPRVFGRGRAIYHGDVADASLIERVVTDHPDIECTIHMAARVVVPESVADPYLYYRDNVVKSLKFFRSLERLGKPHVVFSSSASVYAAVKNFEVFEDSRTAPASPYAWTKLMMEVILSDMSRATGLRAIMLRYFNPVGAEPRLRYGMHVREPTHVTGQLVLAALGRRAAFSITGTDYPTRDGTGLRDYIHVWDLARAHVRAVEQFTAVFPSGAETSTIINVGTGQGTTVRELVDIVGQVLGSPVPVVEAARRDGDVVGAFANVEKARKLLGWSTELTLHDAVQSALNWSRVRRGVLGYD